jgi:DNA-binding transcriptional MerR regulator
VSKLVKEGAMKELKKRMERDYDNVSDFHRRSRVPVSYETCRRFFIEGQKIAFSNFLAILLYLGFSPSEIKSFLKAPDKFVVEDDHQLCKDIVHIIGESTITLNAEEKAILSAYAKLKETPCIEYVAESAKMCAKAHNVNIDQELKAVLRA